MTTYTVTVQLRSPAETIERKWTAAEDAADAIELTRTHLSYEQNQRIERVLVVEDAPPAAYAPESEVTPERIADQDSLFGALS